MFGGWICNDLSVFKDLVVISTNIMTIDEKCQIDSLVMSINVLSHNFYVSGIRYHFGSDIV